MKPKKKTWKTILLVVVLLGLLSTCGSPSAEQDKPRGTLPSAAASEPAETQPPASKPVPTRAPAGPAAAPTPEPAPTPTPVPVEPAPEPVPAPTPAPAGRAYILNTNTLKFHYPSCSSVNQMNPSNKWEYTGTREQIVSMGYSPCGRYTP